MRPEYNPREVYNGNDTQDEFTFDFKIVNPIHLLVLLVSPTGDVEWTTRGDDTTYFTTTLNTDVAGQVVAGGKITFDDPIETGYKLILLLADDEPTQPTILSGDSRYTMKKIENALDTLSGQIQRIKYQLSRVPQLPESLNSDFNAMFEAFIPGAVVMVDEDGEKFRLVPREEFKGDTGDNGVDGTNGTDGVDGVDGTTPNFFVQSGVPDDISDGNDNDLWFNTDNADLYRKITGAWVVQGNLNATSTPTNVYDIIGDRAGPLDIDATTGIPFSSVKLIVTYYVQGQGGPADITSDPQIGPGTIDGQILSLVCCSDTNSIQLEDGNGLILGGQTLVLGADSIADFKWNGTDWVLRSTNGLLL